MDAGMLPRGLVTLFHRALVRVATKRVVRNVLASGTEFVLPTAVIRTEVRNASSVSAHTNLSASTFGVLHAAVETAVSMRRGLIAAFFGQAETSCPLATVCVGATLARCCYAAFIRP